MTAANSNLDFGTAYGQKPPTYRKELVEVGPGTPMGELMRRYWQPIYATEHLTSDKPVRVRILGEDLVLFRDKQGRAGLVAENCCHRGTSLYYGRIEDDGIRCCYHGWKFDAEGNCLDQPCEIDGGRHRAAARQPWYPVQERYGLVYAYMGPPEKKPILPRWELVENLPEGKFLEVSMYAGYGPKDAEIYYGVLDFNWLQSYENVVDPVHATWLHANHSGFQFPYSEEMNVQLTGTALPAFADPKHAAHNTNMDETYWGVKHHSEAIGPDGNSYGQVTEVIMPNMASVPTFGGELIYFVPVDDTHHLVVQVGIASREGDIRGRNQTHNGRPWWELTPEELRDCPGDYESQSTQGAVPRHSKEHLAKSDRGVILVRRRLEALLKEMAEGKDPKGVSFDTNEPPRAIEAHGPRPLAAE
jgi:phenylpropionate dioxygenase-like ring-hydroxylating dioxygenase large terminal subunit